MILVFFSEYKKWLIYICLLIKDKHTIISKKNLRIFNIYPADWETLYGMLMTFLNDFVCLFKINR